MLLASSSLRYLKGVGPRRAPRLADLGLETLEDLLYVLPFRYDDRRAFASITDLPVGGPPRTVSVRVERPRLIRTRRRGFTIFRAELSDESGSITGIWYNQTYLTRVFTEGRRLLLYGRVTKHRQYGSVLENPEYESLDDEDAEGVHTGRIVPVYRKLGDLTPRMLRVLIHRALAEVDPESLDPLVPPEVAARHELLSRFDALRDTHFPPESTDPEQLQNRKTVAQRCLAFEEIFVLQLALALRWKILKQEPRGISYRISDALRTRLSQLLPFELTGAQKRVLREIGNDLRSEHPMHRLLQGDVGSGKTAVALLTLLVAVENGYQAALMAPTEILIEQHARNIGAILEQGKIDCGLVRIKGSLRAAERRQVLEAIRSGEARLVLGTHAIFEAGVEFSRLGLAVIDEQHRFGVMQRAALAGKGPSPDVLVMTATPIPRSLSLTLYGDLDLSVIDELPPGRRPVRTVVRYENQRSWVYRQLAEAVARGRQAYVVVPLVEETARSDLKAAEEFARQLREKTLAGLRIGMVHGRIKAAEKEATMRAFSAGELDVLVATTVIEVGVDVPQASIMIIEHAERFGLSQLHQLRGRVGRGETSSYCVLMVADGEHGKDARDRLAVMEETADGFVIAQRDLELRGPGAIFGTQQHGLSDLQFLSVILNEPGLVESARDEARRLVDGDDDSRQLAERILDSLRGRWRKRIEMARIG